MNKIARRSIILGVTFGLLVLSLFFANKALAAAPADLEVAMALQKYGVVGQVPLNYGATVKVVSKTTSNGVRIPIAAAPYNGVHLNNVGGVDSGPDTNEISFGIGPTVINSFMGGSYYSTTYNNLAWCGKSHNPSVPDREFELDIKVAYATADRQTITLDGRDYTGRWTGYWHLQGSGANNVSSYFEGMDARVPAINPAMTFIVFVFVEDPPFLVQGYRTYGAGSGTAFAAGEGTNRVDGGSSTTANPYYHTNQRGQHTYSASTTITVGANIYDLVGYTLCVDRTDCHGGARTTGSSVVLGPKIGGYYDLYWHYSLRYDGTIRIEKHLVPVDGYPSAGSPPYNALVGLTNNVNDDWDDVTSVSNPFSRSGIWVNTRDHHSNTQHLNSTHSNPTHVNNDGSYNAWVDVPTGYGVASFTVADSPDPQDTRTMSCTDNINKTGRCTVNAIRVLDKATTTVKFNLRPVSKGKVTCEEVNTPATATTPAITRFYWRGHGIDATNQGSPPQVKLFPGFALPIQTIDGNHQLPNNPTYTDNKAIYTGMLPATKYDFNVELDNAFHDGLKRTIIPVLVTADGNDLVLPTVTVGGDSVPCGAHINWPRAWPWLQTSRGDVIASGQINGQVISPSNDRYPGARLDATINKEAEFLIISVVGSSVVGSSGPFCSTYDYILTNTTATTDSTCKNGAGYSTLKSYPLNTAPNTPDNKDVIVEGVKGVYNTFSKANPICSADKTLADLASITVPDDCLDGAVYKLTGGNTINSSITVHKGRVTIYVEGDLFIDARICYAATSACAAAIAGITNIKDYPNLAIVVNGNVNIASSVRNLSAIIYASGKIDTCATASAPLPTQDCSTTRLRVDGSLVAKNGIRFGRSYYDTSRIPAEQIGLTPQTFVYPAPGISLQSVFSQKEGSYTLHPSEYQPRF